MKPLSSSLIGSFKKIGFLGSYTLDISVIRFLKDYKKDVKTIPNTTTQFIHWRAIKPQQKGMNEISIYENRKLTVEDIKYLLKHFFQFYLPNNPCDAYGQNTIKNLYDQLVSAGFQDLVRFEPHPFPHYLHGNIILNLDGLDEGKQQLLFQLIGRNLNIAKI